MPATASRRPVALIDLDLVAPRAGLPGASVLSGLPCQAAASEPIEAQRVFGAASNRSLRARSTDRGKRGSGRRQACWVSSRGVRLRIEQQDYNPPTFEPQAGLHSQRLA